MGSDVVLTTEALGTVAAFRAEGVYRFCWSSLSCEFERSRRFCIVKHDLRKPAVINDILMSLGIGTMGNHLCYLLSPEQAVSPAPNSKSKTYRGSQGLNMLACLLQGPWSGKGCGGHQVRSGSEVPFAATC